MSNSINEAFGNVISAVDNVKNNLATSISRKGVQTNSTDTFTKMIENVNKINYGSESNNKIYGVGDSIDSDNIEKYKTVSQEWKKNISVGKNACLYGVNLFFIDDTDLVIINVNTGNEIKRKSGFSKKSSMVMVNRDLYILSENNLKIINAYSYNVKKEKTYTTSYSDILIDENYIYLFNWNVGITKVNKTTLEEEGTTGVINTLSNDNVYCVGQTDKFIYISYMDNGIPSAIKITKDTFEKEIKRVEEGLIISMFWHKEKNHLYTLQSGNLGRYSEYLTYYKEIARDIFPLAQEILLHNDKLIVNYDDTYIYIDVHNYDILFKVVLGTNSDSFHFPLINSNRYFSTKNEEGTKKLISYQKNEGYKYKVLR